MTPTQARARAMFDRDLTGQMLGIELEDVSPRRASLRMRVAEWMVNGHSIAHGGCLFLLADAAFAYASNTEGPATVAQSAQIIYLRPALVGDDLVAEAVERARQGRIGVYDVTVRRIGGPNDHSADGSVVAEFRGQSIVLGAPPKAEK